MRPQQVKIGIALAVALVGIGAAAWYNARHPDSKPKETASTNTTSLANRDEAGESTARTEPIHDPGALSVSENSTGTGTSADTDHTGGLASTGGSPSDTDREERGGFSWSTDNAATTTPPHRDDFASPIHHADTNEPTRMEISHSAPPGSDSAPDPAPTPSMTITTPEPVAVAPTPAPLAPSTGLAAAPTTRPADAVNMTIHQIKSGDTFSGLAIQYFGHAKYTSLISKANPDLDPRRLQLGAKVKIPAPPIASATTRPATGDSTAVMASPSPLTGPAVPGRAAVREQAPPVPADRAYTVKPGEGWSELAARFLGDGTRWPELYELNRERVARDPHGLQAGAVIEVPTMPTPAPQPQPAGPEIR